MPKQRTQKNANGIIPRPTADGTTYWVDETDARGSRVRRSFHKEKEAVSFRKKFMGDVERDRESIKAGKGSLGTPSLSERTIVRSIRDLLEFYVENLMIKAEPKSRQVFRSRAAHFVDWCERKGIRYAHQVTPEHALAFAKETVATFNRTTIGNILIATRGIFKAELDWRTPPAIAGNPFARIKPNSLYEEAPLKEIPEGQIDALLSCCSEFEWHLFHLEYAGGFRAGEVRNLIWPMIGTEYIYMNRNPNWKAKTEESGTVIHLNNRLSHSLEWFRSRSGNKHYIIDAETFGEHKGKTSSIPGRVGESFIGKRLKRIVSIAQERFPEYDWTKFTPHQLRHAYGSHLADHGTELPVLINLMRHKSYKSTEKYVKVGKRSNIAAAQRIDRVEIRPFAIDTSNDTAPRSERSASAK